MKGLRQFISDKVGSFSHSAAITISFAGIAAVAMLDQHAKFKGDLKTQARIDNAIQIAETELVQGKSMAEVKSKIDSVFAQQDNKDLNIKSSIERDKQGEHRLTLRALSMHGNQSQTFLGETRSLDVLGSRVYGGHTVPDGKYTFVVALRSKKWEESWCTGTLVSDYHIITAAHCVIDYDIEQCGKSCSPVNRLVLDIGGFHNRIDEKHPQNRPRQLMKGKRDIKSVVIHPNYDRPTLTHDVAVITLKKKVKSEIDRAFIKAGPLTNAERRDHYMAAGFGVQDRKPISETGSDYVLAYHKTRMLRKEQCQNLSVKIYERKNLLTQDEICTSNLPRVMHYIKSDIELLPYNKEQMQTSTSGCSGDSGSPLFTREKLQTRRLEKNKKHRLMAVLSWRVLTYPDKDDIECSGAFDGYADISRNMNFLRSQNVPIY